MEEAFREALIRHFSAGDDKIADLVNQTGVSRSKINKLLRRENSTVELTDAIAIATFYRKSVEQFTFGTDGDALEDDLSHLTQQLTPQERQHLVPQIRGVIAHRLRTQKERQAEDAEE